MGTTWKIVALADAEYRRQSLDPKRVALFTARRRRFFAALRGYPRERLFFSRMNQEVQS